MDYTKFIEDAAVIRLDTFIAVEEDLDTVEEKAEAYRLIMMNYLTDTLTMSESKHVNTILRMCRAGQVGSMQRHKKAKENGGEGGKDTKIDRTKVLNLRDQGYTQDQIGKELDCSDRQVRRILKELEADTDIRTLGHNADTDISGQADGHNLKREIKKENKNINQNQNEIKNENGSQPVDEKLDSLVADLAFICSFSDYNSIRSIIMSKLSNSLTIFDLYDCLNYNYDEISKTLAAKNQTGKSAVSYAMGVLKNKIIEAEKASSKNKKPMSDNMLKFSSLLNEKYGYSLLKANSKDEVKTWLNTASVKPEQWIEWINSLDSSFIMVGINILDDLKALYHYKSKQHIEVDNTFADENSEAEEDELPF